SSFAMEAAPAVSARSVILVEAARGAALVERNADEPIPPASLAKLATLAVLGEELDSGRLSLSTPVEVLPGEAWDELPWNSSAMYLERGMRLTVGDLARGLAVASANDAAFVLARVVSGSVSQFAARMNAVARRYGLSVTRFEEPSGLSDRNVTTAREMARFALAYLAEREDFLKTLHSLPSIQFPRAANFPPGRRVPAGFEPPVLENRNPLLGAYPGCDGLKTGYITESGFNFVATAEREGTRFVLVLLGGVGTGTADAQARRLADGSALLDWAFGNWVTVRPALPDFEPARVWKGARRSLAGVPAGSLAATVPRSLAATARASVEAYPELMAPISAGAGVGIVKVLAGDEVYARVELVAGAEVKAGSWLRRLIDSIALFFRKAFGGSAAPVVPLPA
ncbi:MAG TPA: D-alanyl-D-alanine carboxypeptidase family protein, partial [Spirochaetales bacterium]|nr:D-alanyl-D-alanine carboxypeptidase family protein [Spirochaetales bacterium]